MSDAFRTLLQKVGSGPHTSKDLTRSESCEALTLILQAEATPAQIGAFFISHRIKRPTGDELAGFLDALSALGPEISAQNDLGDVVVLSNAYDGRSRTAPLSPISSLMLATAGIPVLMHGSIRMPTKYGIPILDVWNLLGIPWQGLSLEQVTTLLRTQRLSFLHMGDHFPAFQALIPYRAQLGKRPPLATAELLWCPYQGNAKLVSGYVHPPTETMLKTAFHCRGRTGYTTVKGLEGSVDLPRDRTAIIGVHRDNQAELDRHLLHAWDYGLGGPEVAYESPEKLQQQMTQVLNGQASELMPAVLWNSGFYLWHFGPCETLADGIELARSYIQEGKVKETLDTLKTAIGS